MCGPALIALTGITRSPSMYVAAVVAKEVSGIAVLAAAKKPQCQVHASPAIRAEAGFVPTAIAPTLLPLINAPATCGFVAYAIMQATIIAGTSVKSVKVGNVITVPVATIQPLKCVSPANSRNIDSSRSAS